MHSKIKNLSILTLVVMLAIILFTACSDSSSPEIAPYTPTEPTTELPTDPSAEPPVEPPTETSGTDTHETAPTDNSIIGDYRALESLFFSLYSAQESTMTAVTRFDLLPVDGAAIYVDTQQIRTDGRHELTEISRSRDVHGAPISHIEMTIYDGMLYLDIHMALFFVMLEVLGDLEGFGISMEDVPFAHIAGPYTHMQSVNIMEDTLRIGIYDIFPTPLLENYLSILSDGTFRIELPGHSMDNYIHAVLETMYLDDISLMLLSVEMIADIDVGLRAEMEENFARWLRSGNLSDGQMIIERKLVDDHTFHQTIELYIPDRVSIRHNSTVILDESTPISTPSQFLTAEALGERIVLWIMELVSDF